MLTQYGGNVKFALLTFLLQVLFNAVGVPFEPAYFALIGHIDVLALFFHWLIAFKLALLLHMLLIMQKACVTLMLEDVLLQFSVDATYFGTEVV